MTLNFNELFYYIGLIRKDTHNIYKVISRSKTYYDDCLDEDIISSYHPLYSYLQQIDIDKVNLKEINDNIYFCIKCENNYYLFCIDKDKKEELELSQQLLDHKSVILFEGEIDPTHQKIKINNIDTDIEKIIDKDLILNKYLDEVFEMSKSNNSLYVYDDKFSFYLQTISIDDESDTPQKIVGCLINTNEKEFFKDIDYKAFRNLLNNLNESIIILDLNHDVVYANNRSHLLFRKNLIELKHDWDYINCVDENKNPISFVNRPYRKAIHEKKDILNKTLGYRLGEDGNLLWLLSSSRLIYDEFNIIKGTINSYLDITQDKVHSDQIKELLIKLESHNTNIPLSVIEFDENLVIQKWNWKAEELFKFKSREILDKNINDINIIHQDHYLKFYEAFEDLIKGKDLRNIVEVKNYNKDKDIRHCTWFNSVITNNNIISIISYILDTTNEKELLQKNKETEDRLKTIINLLPNRTIENVDTVNTKLVDNLINNPLTEKTNEQSIKAEILLRLLEEEVKKINTTLYHNGKAMVTRVAIIEQNQTEDRIEFTKLNNKIGSVENKIEGLGHILNWTKLLNKQSLIWIVVIIAFGSVTFESILLPGIMKIRNLMNDKIEMVVPSEPKEKK